MFYVCVVFDSLCLNIQIDSHAFGFNKMSHGIGVAALSILCARKWTKRTHYDELFVVTCLESAMRTHHILLPGLACKQQF